MRRMLKTNFSAQRQAVKDRRQRKADQGGGKRPAENDDDGVIAHEHAEAAAHQHQGHDDRCPGKQAEARCNIHKPHPTRRRRAPGNGLIRKVIALKGRLPMEPSCGAATHCRMPALPRKRKGHDRCGKSSTIGPPATLRRRSSRENDLCARSATSSAAKR